jgi:16S rRNA (cytosine967-C5)-methyltransferase
VQLQPEYHDAVRDAFYDVVAQHRHLSSAIERMFRDLKPDAVTAQQIRATLFQAVRYDDVDAALSGILDGVADPSKACFPNWLRERLVSVFADDAQQVMSSMLCDAQTFVRVNTHLSDISTCSAALAPFQPLHIEGEMLRIDKPFGLFTSEAFQRGWFEQQDITSYKAACELECLPGMRIVDACAGAGGKALVFASHMKNKGRIIALDTQASKLDALRTRATRAGIDIIETREITTTKVVKRLHESADGVFIDVPCTGTGVLRRNPDILHRITEDSLRILVGIQADVLRRSAPIARVGASVVYTTCSVLPEEGSLQIHAFLDTETGKKFSLQNEWSSVPNDAGGDGFYVARLRREA